MRLEFECDQRWDDFEGNDPRVRRCRKCDHLVHNLSAMTRDEVRALFESVDSKPCVTFARRGDAVMFVDDLERLRAQREGVRHLVRAAAFVAPVLIAGCLDEPVPRAEEPVEVQVRFGEPSASLRHGTMTDRDGQPLNPEYVAYLRDKQRTKSMPPPPKSKPKGAKRLANALEKMFGDVFGDDSRKEHDVVVAGSPVSF